MLSQNVTYLQLLEKGGASLSTKEMSNCYATGFALFYAKLVVEECNNQVLLPFFRFSETTDIA